MSRQATTGPTLHEARITAWRPLGAVAPTALADARGQLHHAAQVANAAAISLLPPAPDDSHTSFAWSAALGALVAREIPAPRPFRVALQVEALALTVLDLDDAPLARFPLDGHGRDDAVAWLQAWTTRAGGDGARVTMRRHFEIPGTAPDASHPWRLGDGAAFRELAAWYGNADALLRAFAASEPGAGPVRCWPHHFDIATLVDEGADAGGAKHTTGVGLSPGDDSYAEPYLYVGPYPYPRADALPALAAGHWHREGWVGAVLTGSEIVAASAPDAQARLATTFVSDAVAAVRALRAASR
jgi:hypothetical protein